MTAGLFRRLLQLPLRYLHSRRVGDLLTRFEDNHRLLNLMAGKALMLALDALIVFIGLGLMWHYSGRLTLVALLALLGCLALTLFFSSRLKRLRASIFHRCGKRGIRSINNLSLLPLQRRRLWRRPLPCRRPAGRVRDG